MRESQQDGGECRNEATPVGTTEENDKLPDAHRLNSQKPAKMSCNAALGALVDYKLLDIYWISLVFFEATEPLEGVST